MSSGLDSNSSQNMKKDLIMMKRTWEKRVYYCKVNESYKS